MVAASLWSAGSGSAQAGDCRGYGTGYGYRAPYVAPVYSAYRQHYITPTYNVAAIVAVEQPYSVDLIAPQLRAQARVQETVVQQQQVQRVQDTQSAAILQKLDTLIQVMSARTAQPQQPPLQPVPQVGYGQQPVPQGQPNGQYAPQAQNGQQPGPGQQPPGGQPNGQPPPIDEAKAIAVLQKNCARCHTGAGSRGNPPVVLFAATDQPVEFTPELKSLIGGVIDAGEMPPPPAKLGADEYEPVLAWSYGTEADRRVLRERLKASMRQQPPVPRQPQQ